MPVQVSYPGVYVQEVPSGVVSISGVATSIALFIGMAQRGPMNTPRLVLNRTAYETEFGTDTSQGEMTDQVRQFFLNGGGQAYIMRVAQNAQAARVDVENEFGAHVFTFEAKDAGTIGESIRIEIDYETSQPEATFNVTVYRHVTGAGGQIQQAELETHKDLSTDPNSASYVVDVLEANSRLIRAILAGAPPAATAGYALSGAIGFDNAAAAAADAALFAAIDTAIANAIAAAGPGATSGRFEISVDGQPFVPVALTAPIAAFNDIAVPINAALAPLGVGVVVDSLDIGDGVIFSHVLRITSNTAGLRSSVRIRRASTLDDIAEELQLGNDDFGIEAGGGAVRRPMPTGIVARLGAAPGNMAAIAALLNASRAAVTGLLLTDSSGGIQSLFGLAGATDLYQDPISGNRSLQAGRVSLDAIVTALNTAFQAAPPPRRWTAVRSGYRIVLKSNLATPDSGPGTTIVTAGGGAFDFALAGSYLEAATRTNVKAYRPGAAIGAFTAGSLPGTNGIAPNLATYDAAYTVARRDVDLFNILMLPRNVGQTDNDRATYWGAASAFAKERRAVLLMDPRSDWQDVTQARAGLTALRNGVVKDYTAIYWPRIVINDPVTGAERRIDPAGTVAGICARIDASRGVWKAPAGLEAALIGARALDRRMSDQENGVINPEALNALRGFPSGIVVWGARTMDGFDNSGNTDYRYLPVRRTALMIEESLYRGLKFAVFEPNDAPLWGQIRLAAGAFMNGLFRQGAFQGQKASDAYFVKCDAETTTQTDINLGIVNVLVGFAPLKPAEFIVLTVQQKAGQVQA
jgi:phage tail sheath protein FI